MSKKVTVGFVGCGHRLTSLGTYLKDKVEIKAICEPNNDCIANFQKYMPGSYLVTADYDELLATDDLDWVLIGSPNNMHAEHITKAFKAGKNVFSEKPLATTTEDCVEICQVHKQSGKQFVTGFVLRFSPHYKKIKELLDHGAIGDIVSFEFDECIPHYHGGHIMKGWRRLKEISGGHIVEKCCHDIDLANWFVGSLAEKIASFGGLNFFTPENSHIVDEIGQDEHGQKAYSEWQHVTTQANCPFKIEKSIIDNQVAIMEYRNGVRATFHASLNAGLPKRSFYICGTRGAIETEWYSGKILLKRIGHKLAVEDFSTPSATSTAGHGGADEIIMDSLYETMTSGSEPLCGGQVGLLSTITALAMQKAMEDKQIIDMTDIWKDIGVSP
jgi:predicted dehydrogenase